MKSLRIFVFLFISLFVFNPLFSITQKELELIDAVEKFDKDAVKKLIKLGVNPSIRDSNGKAALHYSVKLGNEDIIKILLSSKLANINVKDSRGATMFHYSFNIITPDIANMLINYGANLNIKTYENETYLHAASGTDFIDIAKILLNTKKTKKSKLDYMNSLTKGGLTALHYAAFYNKLDMVIFLLDNGADIKMRNLEGQSAGDIARENGYTDIALYLAERENL